MSRNRESTVVDLVDAQARRRPRTMAIVDRLQRLTYERLERSANRLANHLRTKPVEPGDVVGIALEPSCDLAVALLAVWKAGAVALPMEPGFPPARLARMLEDAGCRHVITQSAYAESFSANTACAVHLDAERPWIERQPDHAPHVAAHRLAYLLYTSGSTGRPKGVAVPQRALVNKLVHPGAWGPLDARCRAAWHGSPAFDASLAQLLLPLVHGGCVRALDGQERLDARQLWAALRAHRTTVLDCTPSWLMAMLDAAPRGLPLERIVLGGEILTPALARRVRERFPTAGIVNVYGPTEACIDATAHELTDADFVGDTIPIGRPLPGYRVRLLDPALRSVPDGEPGELCIGGIGLADGYWNQPHESAQRFVADPSLGGERLYRTGDLARSRPDGALEFLGRSDQQIKLRGQRIELGEIEVLLTRQPGVSAGVVRTWPAPGGAGDPVIVAYAVLAGGTSAAAVRERLRQELPACMVPSLVIDLDELPLLLTGKVDREALPPPAVPRKAAAVPTLDSLERALVDIWREVLGVDVTDVHDNFFQIGGDSLAAVEMTQCIGERFGIDVPLMAVLAHPTVADLAIALLRGRHATGSGRVLKLGGGGGDAAPLFLLPPGSGAGLVYAGLARELADCAPCLALQAVGLEGGPPGTHSMESLAARFVADVEQLQPRGDVRLCGYSAGGAVAHEMTRQLVRRGRRVSHLVLIDPYCADLSDSPGGTQPETGEAVFRSACRDMLWDAMGLRGRAAEPVLQIAQRLLDQGLAQAGADRSDAAARRTLGQARRVLPPAMNVDVFLLLLEGVTNLCHAYAGHRIEALPAFDAEVWLVQPDADDAAFRNAREAHWRLLVGATLRAHLVPGEHSTMLQRATTVAAIGELLRQVFEPVQEAA